MIIVSRHEGAVGWLRQHGVEGHVVEHATAEDVEGQDVVGNLPLHLAVLASSVTVVEFDHLPAEARGRDLSPAEMDKYGAHLRRYKIQGV